MLTVKRTFTGALAQTGTTSIDVTEYGAKLTVGGNTVFLTHDDLYRLGRFMVYTSIPSEYAKDKGREDIVMLNPPKTPILKEGAVEKAIKKNKKPKEIKKPFFDAVISPNDITKLLEDTEKLPVLVDDETVVEI